MGGTRDRWGGREIHITVTGYRMHWLPNTRARANTCTRTSALAHTARISSLPPPPFPTRLLICLQPLTAQSRHTHAHTHGERERERESLKKIFFFLYLSAAIDRPGPPKSLLASRATIRAAAAAAQLEHQKAQVEHANQGTESEGPGDEIRQSLPSQGAEKHAGLAADMRRDAKITLGVGGDPSVSGVRESSVYESEASNPHKWTISESFD